MRELQHPPGSLNTPQSPGRACPPRSLPLTSPGPPHQQYSRGTAGHGGTTEPAGKASRQPAPCSEEPVPGCNWGTGPGLGSRGPVGSRAPEDTADTSGSRPSSLHLQRMNSRDAAQLGLRPWMLSREPPPPQAFFASSQKGNPNPCPSLQHQGPGTRHTPSPWPLHPPR